MNIKLNSYTIGTLMVFCTIQTTVYCSHKALEFAPEFKTNDPQILLELVLNEVDLVKVAAYKQLKIIYDERSMDYDFMYYFYFTLIESAAELVRHYGVVKNISKIKQTYDEGIRYAKKCSDVMTEYSMSVNCCKWRAVLIEAYYFSNSKFSNRKTMESFKKSYRSAKSFHGQFPPHLEYLEIKMSCKKNLKTQSKKNSHKKSNSHLENTPNQENLDCISKLLHYKDSIKLYESYTGEYYYLLGQFLVIVGDYSNALEYFHRARELSVVDKKSRYINRKVQASIEKIYIREHTPEETVQ